MGDKTPTGVLAGRFRRLADALESDWLFRWPTLVLYVTISVPFVSVSEFNRLVEPTLSSAVGVAALSVGLAVALIVAIGPIVKRQRKAKVLVVVIALMSIGVIRAAIVTVIVDGMGINRESFYASRTFLSLGAVPVLAIVSTLIVATLAQGWRERAQTRRAIERLRNERDAILNEITHAEELLLTESERTLRPSVERLVTLLGSAPRKTVASHLDDLNNSVVRPLSHSMAAQARTKRTAGEMISVPETPPRFPTADSFVGPLVAALAVYLTTVVIFFDVIPLLEEFLSALVGAFVTWAGLRLFKALLAGMTVSLPFIVSIVVIAHIGIGLVVAWVDVTLFSQYGVGIEIAPAMVMATLVPGLIYVAQRLVAHQAELRLAELTAARRDISLDVSELRRSAWLRQRRIAHALHSAIQSRIHAEAQLVRSARGALSDEEKIRIENSLESMFDIVRGADESSADVLGELRRAIEFWSGMCAIEFTIDPELERLLLAEPEIGESVLATSLETISNGIRHGKASQMTLSIQRASEDLIQIRSTNNGVVLGEVDPGLGMAMFDELTVNWSLVGGATTTFTGYIAARQPVANDATVSVSS